MVRLLVTNRRVVLTLLGNVVQMSSVGLISDHQLKAHNVSKGGEIIIETASLKSKDTMLFSVVEIHQLPI